MLKHVSKICEKITTFKIWKKSILTKYLCKNKKKYGYSLKNLSNYISPAKC